MRVVPSGRRAVTAPSLAAPLAVICGRRRPAGARVLIGRGGCAQYKEKKVVYKNSRKSGARIKVKKTEMGSDGISLRRIVTDLNLRGRIVLASTAQITLPGALTYIVSRKESRFLKRARKWENCRETSPAAAKRFTTFAIFWPRAVQARSRYLLAFAFGSARRRSKSRSRSPLTLYRKSDRCMSLPARPHYAMREKCPRRYRRTEAISKVAFGSDKAHTNSKTVHRSTDFDFGNEVPLKSLCITGVNTLIIDRPFLYVHRSLCLGIEENNSVTCFHSPAGSGRRPGGFNEVQVKILEFFTRRKAPEIAGVTPRHCHAAIRTDTSPAPPLVRVSRVVFTGSGEEKSRKRFQAEPIESS
ncbi:hypothetical protein EVAR_17774_1 [Eumeta japonica]|uniref:Uncharacterized protein n=1 Tax=Eumeta variegata TaxID=151549 RepID=A0A4C1TTR0_EUMVA|nr:hypothetical protein EVAR_17774_1 [Eumeta japonica]